MIRSDTATAPVTAIKDFKMPRATRSKLLGAEPRAVTLAKCILEGMKIEGEVPHELKKDRRVQQAALKVFSEAINAAKTEYFSNDSNRFAAFDPKLQAEAKEVALSIARTFDLARHSPKELTQIMTSSLRDSLERMRPYSSIRTTGYALEVAEELGIKDKVLGNKRLQRTAAYALHSSLGNTFDISKFSTTYSEGIDEAIAIVQSFNMYRHGKDELFSTLTSTLGRVNQTHLYTKHAAIYQALHKLTEAVGASTEFFQSKDVQKCGLFSISEHLKSIVKSPFSSNTDDNIKILEIADLLKLVPDAQKTLSTLLVSASQRAYNLLHSGNAETANQILSSIAESWSIQFTAYKPAK